MRVTSLLALGMLAFAAFTQAPTHALGVRANGRGKGKADSAALLEVSNIGGICSSALDGTVSTTTTYGYLMQTYEIPPAQTNFVFTVQASNDAHILLAENSDGSGGVYEIVLSGWGNTQSAIRKVRQSTNLATGSSRNALSGTEARTFWVSWAQGYIALGRGNTVGRDMIVGYQDPNPTVVRFTGVSTGWGSTGVWSNAACAGNYRACTHSVLDQSLFTKNVYEPYQMMPYDVSTALRNPTSFTFSVQASNDAHILLADSITGTGNIYEIVLSGWGNTQSVIRKGRQGTNMATAASNNALSSTELRSFWVSWANGRIALGRGTTAGTDEIVAYQDPSPTSVFYAGFSTGWGSTGLWGPTQCTSGFKPNTRSGRLAAPAVATVSTSRSRKNNAAS